MLTAWYSGWYNGLAKKHFINVAAVEGRRARGHRVLQGEPDEEDHRGHRRRLQGRAGEARHRDEITLRIGAAVLVDGNGCSFSLRPLWFDGQTVANIAARYHDRHMGGGAFRAGETAAVRRGNAADAGWEGLQRRIMALHEGFASYGFPQAGLRRLATERSGEWPQSVSC